AAPARRGRRRRVLHGRGRAPAVPRTEPVGLLQPRLQRGGLLPLSSPPTRRGVGRCADGAPQREAGPSPGRPSPWPPPLRLRRPPMSGPPVGRAGAGLAPISCAAKPPASRGIGAPPVGVPPGPQAAAAADVGVREAPPSRAKRVICSVVG